MNGDKAGDMPDWRALAQQLLTILDPAVKAVETLLSSDELAPGKCSQVWCPVCAVVAIASGEQHPLGSVITEHGAAILTLVRAMAGDDDSAQPHSRGPDSSGRADKPEKYQPIPVTVHE